MEIKFAEAKSPAPVRHRLDSLSPGQCVIANGKVFVRPAALVGGRPRYEGKEISAIAVDGSDGYVTESVTFAEVYEIESITLRRIK